MPYAEMNIEWVDLRRLLGLGWHLLLLKSEYSGASFCACEWVGLGEHLVGRDPNGYALKKIQIFFKKIQLSWESISLLRER